MTMLLSLWATLWLGGAARADEPLSFEAVRTVVYGQDEARVIFHAGDSGHLSATATCSGRSWRLSRDVSARSTVELRFEGLPEGNHHCHVEVDFDQSNGASGSTGFDVDVACLPLLSLSSTLADIDLAHGTAVVHATRPVSKARVTVYGPKGAQLDQTGADVSDPLHLKLAWDAQGREVIRLVVEAADDNGFTSELELRPWSYSIPHEDVVFATGSDVIADDQVGKLETAWADVVRVVDLYGSDIPIQLYVAGYTDTVGDAASNQSLSDRRARSIAAWFRGRGFPGAIWYQGFGESVPAVATGDEVDEARNRRAIYLLAADTPAPSTHVPKAAWRKL
ncbi:MAG: OmpA family protein [Alphaproteobacteria bacterium]|nr:OmpA family protein [Alphaproteobacteria bacterium]